MPSLEPNMRVIQRPPKVLSRLHTFGVYEVISPSEPDQRQSDSRITDLWQNKGHKSE
jgi:hypothetical protein